MHSHVSKYVDSFILVQPQCERVSRKEQGDEAFLCGEGDNWYLEEGKLDGSQWKKGIHREA